MLRIVPEDDDDAAPEGNLASGGEDAEEPKEKPSQEETTPDAPAPLPKEAFRSWRKGTRPVKKDRFPGGRQALPPLSRFEYEDDLEDDLEDDYPEEEAKQVARQSVQEDDEIVSETLAMVLEKQGHYQKAIAMYEKLVLQIPEKSSFFAAKIEKLKNLIG
jgi:tetratricopeptide (TPR) repeat protein